MLHISVITSPQTYTYIDELVEIFLKLSMKTVQVDLIIWTTLDKEMTTPFFYHPLFSPDVIILFDIIRIQVDKPF